MPRNLDRRVEAMVPIRDRGLRRRLGEILDVCLRDDVLAWRLRPDGSSERVPTIKGLNSQRRFTELALARAHPGLVPADA